MRVEIKKHKVQMNKNERNWASHRLSKNIKNLSLDTLGTNIHLLERAVERKRYNIGLQEIVDSIKDCDIIEYKHVLKFDKLEERMLLRSKKSYNGENICIVYSLTNKRVITLWFNSVNDSHKTLRLNEYNANMKMC